MEYTETSYYEVIRDMKVDFDRIPVQLHIPCQVVAGTGRDKADIYAGKVADSLKRFVYRAVAAQYDQVDIRTAGSVF